MRPVQIIEATQEHVAALSGRVRLADEAEAWALCRMSAVEATRVSLAGSAAAWTWIDRGSVGCIWGVAPAALVTGAGIPWLVSTESVEQAPFTFLRLSKICCAYMREMFPRLENYCDARHEASLKWLAWLGFHVDEPAPHGALGLPFRRFWVN